MNTTALTQTWEREVEPKEFQNNGMTALGLAGCLAITLVACFCIAMKMSVDKTLRIS